MIMGALKILYGNGHISILFYRISADSYTHAHSHILILVKGERKLCAYISSESEHL